MQYLFILNFLFWGFLSEPPQVGPVESVTMEMSQGVQNGFKILIPEVDRKGAEKSWEKFVKEQDGKTSRVSKSEDLESTNVLIPFMEDPVVTVFANFSETPEGLYMYAFVKSGKTYYTHGSDKSAGVSDLLKRFMTTTALEAIEKSLETEVKALEKLEKEQRNLQQNSEKYAKDIQRANEIVAGRLVDLGKNDGLQNEKQNLILEQKQKIDQMNNEREKYQKQNMEAQILKFY